VQVVEAALLHQRVSGVFLAVLVQAVELLPGLLRDDVAYGARVLAGVLQRIDHGARVASFAHEEPGHGALVGATVQIAEELLAAHDLDQLVPARAHRARQVEHHVQVHEDQARGVLGALDVARHPVNALGNA